MIRRRRATIAAAAAAALLVAATPPAHATTRTWPGGVKVTTTIPAPAGRTISATTKTVVTSKTVTTRSLEITTWGQIYRPGPDGPEVRLDRKVITHRSWGPVTYTYRTATDYSSHWEKSGLLRGHQYRVVIKVRVYDSRGNLITTTGTYFSGPRAKLPYDAVPDGR